MCTVIGEVGRFRVSDIDGVVWITDGQGRDVSFEALEATSILDEAWPVGMTSDQFDEINELYEEWLCEQDDDDWEEL